MLTQLLDVFGLLSVLLRGGALASKSLGLGGAVFTFCIPKDIPGGPRTEAIVEACRRLTLWSAVTLAAIHLCDVAADSAVLAGAGAGIRLTELTCANFFIAGVSGIGAASAVAVLTSRRKWSRTPGLLASAILGLTALVMTSHSAARPQQGVALSILTTLHQTATATWIGGLPYLG